MSARPLLSLLALFALVAMPFGHMAASAHGAAAVSHCHGSPAAPGKADRAASDCALACAAIAPAGPASPRRLPIAADRPEQVALPSVSGLHPEADPPPPRFA